MATETIRRSKRIQNQTNPDIDDIFTSPDERLFKKKLLNANFMGNGYLIFNKYQGINVQVTYLDQILRLRTSAGYDDIDLIQTIVEKYSVEKIRDICELSIECIVSIIDEENKLTFEQFTAESGTDEIAAKVIKILRNNILYCQNKIDAILPKMKIFVDYTADMNCSLNKFVEWMKNNNIHHDYRIDNLETAIQQLNIATLSALCNTKLSDVSKLPIVYSSQFAHVVQAGIKKRFQNLINWFYIAINEYKKSDINKDNEEILEDIEMMSHNNNNSAKLAIQTRALIGMWAVSADTIGVDPRSKPSVWISAQNQIADFGACTQIVANIKQIVNNFTNDRMNIKENHKLKEKDLIIKLLVQTAIENDGNSQAVIDKAKALNLGDLLKDLIDDDYDLEIIATEIDESNDNHN
eukprot:53470_1